MCTQLAKFGIYARSLGRADESHIHHNLGKIGDDVRARASGDETGVEGESSGGAGEFADGNNLVGGLDDGGGTTLEVEPSVGGAAVNAQGVTAHALARRFAGTFVSGSRFKDEHCVGVQR